MAWLDINMPGSGACSTVGINEISKQKKPINLFPNPSRGLVFVNFDGDFNFDRLEVKDLFGRVVTSFSSKEILDKGKIFSLESLNDGVYFCHFISNGKDDIAPLKLIIQK